MLLKQLERNHDFTNLFHNANTGGEEKEEVKN